MRSQRRAHPGSSRALARNQSSETSPHWLSMVHIGFLPFLPFLCRIHIEREFTYRANVLNQWTLKNYKNNTLSVLGSLENVEMYKQTKLPVIPQTRRSHCWCAFVLPDLTDNLVFGIHVISFKNFCRNHFSLPFHILWKHWILITEKWSIVIYVTFPLLLDICFSSSFRYHQ